MVYDTLHYSIYGVHTPADKRFFIMVDIMHG